MVDITHNEANSNTCRRWWVLMIMSFQWQCANSVNAMTSSPYASMAEYYESAQYMVPLHDIATQLEWRVDNKVNDVDCHSDHITCPQTPLQHLGARLSDHSKLNLHSWFEQNLLCGYYQVSFRWTVLNSWFKVHEGAHYLQMRAEETRTGQFSYNWLWDWLVENSLSTNKYKKSSHILLQEWLVQPCLDKKQCVKHSRTVLSCKQMLERLI